MNRLWLYGILYCNTLDRAALTERVPISGSSSSSADGGYDEATGLVTRCTKPKLGQLTSILLPHHRLTTTDSHESRQ